MAKLPLDFSVLFPTPPGQPVHTDPFVAATSHVSAALVRHQLAGSPHTPPKTWLQTASPAELDAATERLRQQNHDAQLGLVGNRRFGK